MEGVLRCSLLERLPLELREAIYSEVLASDHEIVIRPVEDRFSITQNKGPFKLPPLLTSCRQIRYEATSIFFANNTFRAVTSDQSHDALLSPIRWLDALPPVARKNVKNLTINFIYVGLERGALHSWHGTLESLASSGSCAVMAFAELPRHLYDRRKKCLMGVFKQLQAIHDLDHSVINFEVEEFLGDMFPHIWTQCWVDCLEELEGTFRAPLIRKVGCKQVHGRGQEQVMEVEGGSQSHFEHL